MIRLNLYYYLFIYLDFNFKGLLQKGIFFFDFTFLKGAELLAAISLVYFALFAMKVF